MESSEIIERRDKLYREKLSERQAQFIDEFIDPLEVLSNLQTCNIYPRDEDNAVASKPLRQQQKAALFHELADMPFASIDCVTEALELTGNSSLSGLMKLLKLQIGREYPFNNAMITRPPPRFHPDSLSPKTDIQSESHLNGDDRSVRIPLVTLKADPDPDVALGEAALHGNVELLEYLLSSRESLEFEESKSTAIHKAVKGKNSRRAVDCIRLTFARYVETLETSKVSKEKIRKRISRLVNHKDENGNTAMHLAAENESVEIVRRLLDDYQADPFIKNKAGFSPLQIMYLKTPQAVVHLLNSSLTTLSYPSDGNFELQIDFGSLIRKPPNRRRDENAAQVMHAETDLLANLLVDHENNAATKIILPHVIVRTFLELKWERMKVWLYSSMALQIFLHLWYTVFVIQVFLVDCPHLGTTKEEAGRSSESHALNSSSRDRTFFGYLIGEWASAEYAHVQECSLSPCLAVQAKLLFSIGVFFITKEVIELFLLARMGGYRKQHFGKGIKAYISSIENILQLIFSSSMIFICTLVFDEQVTVYKVSFAALSIVIVGALVLMQAGKVGGLGIYVQMLGTATKIFGKLVGTYIGLIIAFSISFSIIFPSDEHFQTFLKSVVSVMVKMTGEVSYDAVVYGNSAEQPRPPIPFAAQVIFLSFALLFPLVLINLLIALVVSDVKILRDKSEVILRSIQVERLYVMETFLIRLSQTINYIGNICGCRRNNLCTMEKWNVITMDPTAVAKNGMVVKMSIKDIEDTQLQMELRSMAKDPTEYGKEYMKKYAS